MTEPDAPRRISDDHARRIAMALAVGSALLGLWLCGRADPVALAPAVPALATPPAVVPDDDAPRGPVPADDCPQLAARDDPEDLALLPTLCPDHALSLSQARAALLAAPSVTAALALRPRLHAHPELSALVDLVAGADVPAPSEAAGDGADLDPVAAVVVPLDATMVSLARLAEQRLVSSEVAHDDRTRAQALLAKIYAQALMRLGLRPGTPMPPFARRVAALAAYHGRRFCEAYWRRRVAGLADLFADTELGLAQIVAAFEATPFFADDALMIWEGEQALDYVTRSGPASRLADRLETETVDAPAHRIERLVGQGLFDLAVEHAAHAAGSGDPVVGLATAEQLLRDAAARTDRPEAVARIRDRLEVVRARPHAPPETGEGALPAPSWTFPSADRVADEALAWWRAAAPASGFARRHAIARALSTTADRPDATRRVLEAAVDDGAPAVLRSATAVLHAQLSAHAPVRAADADLRIATASGEPARLLKYSRARR